MTTTTAPAFFVADLARMNNQLSEIGAVITAADGWTGIDPSIAPVALVRAYSGLLSMGYANGWL